MKIILAAITFLFYAAQLKAAEQIYVVTISNAKAALSDGTEFNMEKGDTYPFVSYDQSQTLAQLKLGPLTFWARTNNLKLVPEVEVPDASRKYEADVKQFFAKREAAQPAGGRGVNMQLITAEAVKAYWLKGIVEPARMSADEYKIKAANESKRNAINTGQYDGLAQDEANRLNIDLLRQNGDVQAANTLQESRDAYAAQVAAARQMDDFTASLRREMFLQRVEMQRQTRELQNISRQLWR